MFQAANCTDIMATVDVKTVLPSNSLGQPDIGYAPNYDKYLARTSKLAKSEIAKFENVLDTDLVKGPAKRPVQKPNK